MEFIKNLDYRLPKELRKLPIPDAGATGGSFSSFFATGFTAFEAVTFVTVFFGATFTTAFLGAAFAATVFFTTTLPLEATGFLETVVFPLVEVVFFAGAVTVFFTVVVFDEATVFLDVAFTGELVRDAAPFDGVFFVVTFDGCFFCADVNAILHLLIY